MPQTFFSFRPFLLISGLAVLTFAACNDNPTSGDPKDSLKDDSITTQGVKVNGQNFMMPSPIQIAELIKKSGALYDKNILNDPANVSKYSDELKRSLNMGVYGADLGYITMYDNSGDALNYYKTVMTLGEQLKITGSFDKGIMERFGKNVGKKDSILNLVGEAYRRSDDFLKDGQRDQVGGLIITGGWVESIFFATSVYKQKPTPEIATRIGEQKNTVAGLIKLIKGYNREEYAPLIKLLEDLNAVYQTIEIRYTFAEPTHDEGAHLTTINGQTEVKITDEQLKGLTEKITAIRNYIIN